MGPPVLEKNPYFTLTDTARVDLVTYYQSKGVLVHFDRDRDANKASVPIGREGILIRYALLDGRKVTGTQHTRYKAAGSSIVKIWMEGIAYGAGEIRSLFTHSLPNHDPVVFAQITWLDEFKSYPADNVWAQL